MPKKREIIKGFKDTTSKSCIQDVIGEGHHFREKGSVNVEIIDGKIKLFNILYVPSITKA